MTQALIVKFHGHPPVGLAIEHDGQVFVLAGAETYQRADGSGSFVLTWSTTCRECTEPVEFQIGNGFRPKRRNCEAHKWKGFGAHP